MSCILPFINLEARTDGTMSVCCIMQEHALKEDGTEYNLANGDTLSDVKKSKWLKRLQRDFEAGKRPDACANCWNEEKAGIQSKRLRENVYWQDFLGQKKLPTLSMDLKLGNICNSKCRICSSFASSQWVAEEIKWEPETAELKKLVNKKGAWPNTNDNFWEDIDNHLEHVRKLEFFGGEPFLIEKGFKILEKCIDKGIAHKISLSYNTNGSIYPEKFIHLWKHFNVVEIFFSIDDVYDRFEYIRHPGNFEEVIGNLQKFLALRDNKTAGNFEIGIFQTISVYNICNLYDLTKYIREFIDLKIPIHYNMVFTPEHNSPKMLPKEVKEYITKKYTPCTDYVQRTLDFMNGEHYEELALQTFVGMTKFSDQIRNEKFAETFPELHELLKDYRYD